MKDASASKMPPPFFIMGCTRSGTSLLSQILDSHSRLAVCFETYYYPIFRPELQYYGDLCRPSNLARLIGDFLEVLRTQGNVSPTSEEFRKALVAPTFEGILTTWLQWHALQEGKVRGGEKTPHHYIYLPEILERFPGSPVIFLIRDPRDTVLSMRKVFGASIEGASRSWNEAFLSYSRNPSPRVQLVRYEKLVQHPAEVVQDICTFLREPYEPTMLRFFERKPIRSKNRFHRKLLNPIDEASVGSFRQMSAREIEHIEATCAVGMETLGYQFTTRAKVTTKTPPQTPNFLNFVLDRLRYYRRSRKRWRRGWSRWKIALRVRCHYWLTLRQR